MIDVLCYLDDNTQKKVFKWVNDHLYKIVFFYFHLLRMT